MSKYEGIDERTIKCCDNSSNTIEAGISFEKDTDGVNVLRFHFLEKLFLRRGTVITQTTKTMHLNKENTRQLIKAIAELDLFEMPENNKCDHRCRKIVSECLICQKRETLKTITP